jgi:hypothetical protein
VFFLGVASIGGMVLGVWRRLRCSKGRYLPAIQIVHFELSDQ